MKNIIVVVAVGGLLAGTFLTSCDRTPEQKLDSAKQEVKDARAAYLAEWESFKRESEQSIEANEKSIDEFKAKMEKASSKVKAKYNKEVASLEQKNRDLKKKLAEYKDEGQIKWEEFKTNFKHDMESIGKTMKDLFKSSD